MTEVLVDGCTAYVEVANSAGLQMLPKEERDPNYSTSTVSV